LHNLHPTINERGNFEKDSLICLVPLTMLAGHVKTRKQERYKRDVTNKWEEILSG
jgi:hypothetical protein